MFKNIWNYYYLNFGYVLIKMSNFIIIVNFFFFRQMNLTEPPQSPQSPQLLPLIF